MGRHVNKSSDRDSLDECRCTICAGLNKDAKNNVGDIRNDGVAVACLGIVGYLEALNFQKHVHKQVSDGLYPGIFLLLEHPHVYTLGRRGKDSDILISNQELDRIGAKVYRTDRGGEVTYHGPGQLVGYPIVDLKRWGGGPLSYVKALENMISNTLVEFGINPNRENKPTGVWVGHSKIAAIGVKISQGTTLHGFALNVNPDLSYFNNIVPCGMKGIETTSMAALLSKSVSIDEVSESLMNSFEQSFGLYIDKVLPEATKNPPHSKKY